MVEYTQELKDIFGPNQVKSANGTGLFEFEDIAFVNTSIFQETANYYRKHGVYTKAPRGSQEWKEFWDIEEDRRRNGMKAPGKLVDGKIQEVWITGKHYGYLNYAQIELTRDTGAIGIDALRNNGELVRKTVTHSRHKGIDFPDFFDGDYHYYKSLALARHLGLNLTIAKKRRAGYSFKNGWVAADEIDLNRGSSVLMAAYLTEYLYPKGTMTMADQYLQFLHDARIDPKTGDIIWSRTDFYKGRSIDRKDHIRLGFYSPDSPSIERGYKSEIRALTFNSNPGVARGKSPRYTFIEEGGKAPNLKDFINSTQPSLEDGSYVTGMWVLFGTGGGDNTNWEDFEDIFYNPTAWKCLPFNNVWDEGLSGTNCSFFVPQYMNVVGSSYRGNPMMDEHGNSLIEEAKIHMEYERAQKKASTKSIKDYADWIAERCATPAEAFSVAGDNIFDTTRVRAQLQKVLHDPYISNLGIKGYYYKEGNSAVQLRDLNKYGEKHDYIVDFPLKPGDDPWGCVIEWEGPIRVNGEIPQGLYRIVVDPYDHDKDSKDIKQTDSLGSMWVYMVINNIAEHKGDVLVAEFTGRPPRADDFNEQVLLAALRWNVGQGGVQFENDRGNIKNFFRLHDAYDLLADEPDFNWNPRMAGKSGRGKGVHMNEDRKGTGALMHRDWDTTRRGRLEDGTEVINLDYIYSPAYLKEMIKFKRKGNFDRLSANIIRMFDRQEVALNNYSHSTMKDELNEYFSRVRFRKRR